MVSLATLAAWIVTWRRKLRADGVLSGTSWREARALRRRARDEEQAAAEERAAADVAVSADAPPDPARVLSELRALLIPLLPEPEAVQPDPGGEPAGREPVRDELPVMSPSLRARRSRCPGPAAWRRWNPCWRARNC